MTSTHAKSLDDLLAALLSMNYFEPLAERFRALALLDCVLRIHDISPKFPV